MRKNLLFLFFLGISSSAYSQVEWEMMTLTSFVRGVGEQKGFNYLNIGTEIGYGIPKTPFFINTFYSGGTYNNRAENLPMYTAESGYGENVRVQSFGGIRSMGLRLRYSPQFFKSQIYFPFVELGGGHARYRQRWKTQGELVDDPESMEGHKKYAHKTSGYLNQSATFFVSREMGILIKVLPFDVLKKFNEKRAGWYMGISVRYEIGGIINYTNPMNNPRHFYYNSGLGDAFDRPFQSEPTSNDKDLVIPTRHNQLIFKITAFRMIY